MYYQWLGGAIFFLSILFFLFIYFREKGREGERGRETLIGCLSHDPNQELGPQPGMCPDWDSNQQPFGWQAGTQSTEPHQPGRGAIFLTTRTKSCIAEFQCLHAAPGVTHSELLSTWLYSSAPVTSSA